MAEWIISSTALLLLLLLLRLLLRRRASPELIYALWLLALLRLLLPFSIGESRASLLNAVAPSPAYAPAAEAPPVESEAWEPADSAVSAEKTAQTERREGSAVITVSEKLTRQVVSWRVLLLIVWIIGAGVVLVWSLICNVCFFIDLRTDRQPLAGPWAVRPKRIYISRALRSPCLFGLFRPSIYVTVETAADQQTLAHVLAHERAHYRHGDPIWGVLRVLVLALHWYNPLVWLAARLSRQDAESAADASAIAALGEKERILYGETLISLVQRRPKVREYMSCGTTMFGSKRVVRRRVSLIAARPRTAAVTLVLVLLGLAAAALCTFTGSGQKLFPSGESLRPVITPKPSLAEGREEKREKAAAPEIAPASADDWESVLSSGLFRDCTEYSYEEYRKEYGYPLAEPDNLPEGYAACGEIFVREYAAGAQSINRLWYCRERQEALLLSQWLSRENDLPLAFYFSSTDEGGRPISKTYPWANFYGGLQANVGGWTVHAQMFFSASDREIQCEKICRSVTLEGQSLDTPAGTGEILTNSFSGSLPTVNGVFRFEAGLYAQGEGGYTMRLRLEDPNGLPQRLDFPMPYSFAADTLDYLWQAEDVDQDGSQDLILDIGEYEGGPRAMCFVFDGEKNGYVPLEGFDRYIYLGFDREKGLVCSSMGSGEYQSYMKVRVHDGRMELCASLVINRSLPEDQQCSEYGLNRGRLVPVQEKVPASAIDKEEWYFADLIL